MRVLGIVINTAAVWVLCHVTPAKAGVHPEPAKMDPRLRGDDQSGFGRMSYEQRATSQKDFSPWVRLQSDISPKGHLSLSR